MLMKTKDGLYAANQNCHDKSKKLKLEADLCNLSCTLKAGTLCDMNNCTSIFQSNLKFVERICLFIFHLEGKIDENKHP